MAEPLQLALRSAIATGDIGRAIKEHDWSLTRHDKEILQGMSKDDLENLGRLEDAARGNKGMMPIKNIDPRAALKGDWIGGIW